MNAAGNETAVKFLCGAFGRARINFRGRRPGRGGGQWNIRTSVLCVFLAMHLTPSSAARGYTGHIPPNLSSAFQPAANQAFHPGVSHPALFGTTEIKATDLAYFTKWTSVMSRFGAQMKGSGAGSPAVLAWLARLRTLRDKSDREKMEGVNDYMNSIAYVDDRSNYGVGDYWATPIEFLARGGDCEDYAIAKYASLRALGFAPDQLRVTVVRDKVGNEMHVMLVVYSNEGVFILDNQDRRLRRMENVTRYKATFSLNSENWWLYKAGAA